MDGSPTDPPGRRRLRGLAEVTSDVIKQVDAFHHLLVLIAEHELDAAPEIVAWLEAGLDTALDGYAAQVRASARKSSGAV